MVGDLGHPGAFADGAASFDRFGPAAAHASALAAARPARKSARCASVTRSSTRHAVGVDATGPNRPGFSRSEPSSLRESVPSMIATATSPSTLPGVGAPAGRRRHDGRMGATERPGAPPPLRF